MPHGAVILMMLCWSAGGRGGGGGQAGPLSPRPLARRAARRTCSAEPIRDRVPIDRKTPPKGLRCQ